MTAEAGHDNRHVGSGFSRTSDHWENVDFVFVPEWAVPTLDLPRLDLTIDLTALQAMTCDRATQHVERAFELGSRYFYTMTRMPTETAFVSAALTRWFWPHPVPPRRDPKLEDMRATTGVEPESELSHLVGWKRMLLTANSQRPTPKRLA